MSVKNLAQHDLGAWLLAFRLARVLAFAIAVLGAAESGAVAKEPSRLTGNENTAQPRSGEHVQEIAPVYREDSQVRDAMGAFRRSGDRIEFVMVSGMRLIALENLNLERIEDKLALDTGGLTWTVSGTVTEYRGQFYLLIRRAKARRSTDQQARQSPGYPARPARLSR